VIDDNSGDPIFTVKIMISQLNEAPQWLMTIVVSYILQ